MKRLALCALLAAAGCGGTEPDYLLGDWVHNLNSPCAVRASFIAGNKYGLSIVCADGPPVEIDMVAGSYSVADGKLYMTADRATCPNAEKFSTEKISVSETSMTWIEDTGLILFRRVDASLPSGSGSAIFGCFDFGKGTFTPSPLAPI